MEPEGAPTETQALQAFFNGAEEENDSVCGTENTGDSRRTPPAEKVVESDIKVTESLSLIPETQQCPSQPAEGTPKMASASALVAEPTPPMPGAGWKQCRQAAKPAPTLDVHTTIAPPSQQSSPKKDSTDVIALGNDENAALANCSADDSQAKSAASPEELQASASPSDKIVTPVADTSAAETAGGRGDAFGSQLLPASTGTQPNSPGKALISAQPESDVDLDMLQTQIETPLQFAVPSAVGKPSESAPPCTDTEYGSGIPESQAELFGPTQLATAERTALDVPSTGNCEQVETQAELPPSHNACNLQNGTDDIPDGKAALKALLADNPSNAGPSAVHAERSTVVSSAADAVTPELQAFAAGSSLPSATGTVIPESEGQATARRFAQPSLLLPDRATMQTEKQTASQGELASGGEITMQDSVDSEGVSPVEGASPVEEALPAQGLPPVEGASPLEGALPAECASPTGTVRRTEGVLPALPDARPEEHTDIVHEDSQGGAAAATGAALTTVQTDSPAGVNDVDGIHRFADVGASDAAADAIEEPEEPRHLTEAEAAIDASIDFNASAPEGLKEEPALADGTVLMHDVAMNDVAHTADADVVATADGSQEGAGSGTPPVADDLTDAPNASAGAFATSAGASAFSASFACALVEAPAEDVVAEDDAGHEHAPEKEQVADLAPSEAAEEDVDMEEAGEEDAAGNSNPRDSQVPLTDSQMMMMTQPADTVDLAALTAGVHDLAKQLCGELPGTSKASCSKAAAAVGPSRLANVTKESAGKRSPADSAAPKNGSAPAAAVQPVSQCPTDHASPNLSEVDTHPPETVPKTKSSDDNDEDDGNGVKGQAGSGKGNSGKTAGKQQRAARPARNNRRRPLRLCDTPSPAQPSKRSSRHAQPNDIEDVKDESPAPAGDDGNQVKQPLSQNDTAPGTAASPALQVPDTLLDLQQRLSRGIPDDEVREQAVEQAPEAAGTRPVKRARRGAATAAPAPQAKQVERASRKRTASQAKQDSADVGQGEQVPDIDMEGSAQPEAAEDTEAAPPGRKRRKKAEPAATAAASKGSQKQARKKPVRKVSRTAAQERESTAEPEASTSHAAPAQAPAHTSRGRKRKAASVSTAAAGRALSVPSTPRQPTSTRLSAADALLSPTRERQEPVILLSSAVSLPRKLANKARSAGLQLREHQSGETVSEFTHFVADELVLSLHTLMALAGGRPIVTTAWLHQSIDGGAAMPVGSLLLEDFQAEKKHKFIMKSSYDTARSKRLLQGCICCVSDSLIKSEADDGDGLKLVLRAALGSDGELLEGNGALAECMSSRNPDDDKRVVVLVEAGADKPSLRRAVPKGVQVWTRPQLVQAVVQQTFSHQHAFLQT